MELGDIRAKIDRIDCQLIKLLDERMELALRTRNLKSQVLDEEREKKVIENVNRLRPGLVPGDSSPAFSRNSSPRANGCRGSNSDWSVFRENTAPTANRPPKPMTRSSCPSRVPNSPMCSPGSLTRTSIWGSSLWKTRWKER